MTKWSDLQLAGFDLVVNTDHNIVIEACAGSGKTTFLVEAVIRLLASQSPRKTFLMAFNQKVNQEAENRLRAQGCTRCVVKSFNSHGWALLRSKYKSIEFNDKKQDLAVALTLGAIDNSDLMSAIRSINDVDHQQMEVNKWGTKYHLGTLVSNVRTTGQILFPEESTAQAYLEYVWASLPNLFTDVLGVDWESPAVRAKALPYVLILADATRETVEALDLDMSTADYSDQVRQPVRLGLVTRANSPAQLFVDESQDLNRYQLLMVARMIDTGTRMISVGDRRQAIYAFRGADELSMDHLRQASSATTHDLSITYRCPSRIVAYVNARIQTETETTSTESSSSLGLGPKPLVAHKLGGRVVNTNPGPVMTKFLRTDPDVIKMRAVNDLKGINAACDKKTLDERLRVIRKYKIDMVVSATNAPLLAIHLELHKKGRPSSLNKLQIIPQMARHAARFSKKLPWEEFLERAANTLDQPKGRVPRHRIDLIRSIMTVVSSLSCTSWVDLNRHLVDLEIRQDTSSKGIDLHTVHSCKGMEAPNVFVINTFFDSSQVVNMEYVALTRAEHLLVTELPKLKTFEDQQTLTIELIPEAQHGTNLRSVLNAGDWEAIKNFVRARSQGRCEICGSGSGPVEAHERWAYKADCDEWLIAYYAGHHLPEGCLEQSMGKKLRLIQRLWTPEAPTVKGVQKLKGLIALCSTCHLAKHYGYAGTVGATETVDKHLMSVNGWTRQELDRYLFKTIEKYEARNLVKWDLDCRSAKDLPISEEGKQLLTNQRETNNADI